MNNSSAPNTPNPLGTEPIGRLIPRFAVPAIISFLVSALYNIVDQIFIGQGVGMLGNAATNVAFPITTISTSLALLLGVGSASNFNLQMGAGNPERARDIAGAGIGAMAIGGTVLATVVLIFLEPLLKIFGATPQVMPLALSYTGITALGLPLVIFSTSCSQLIRADGSPTYSMLCQLSGAILNTILDPLFIFTFDMGIAGAAWATVLGQLVSAIMAVAYLFRFKSIHLTPGMLIPKMVHLRTIVSLGAASCFNQLSMTVVQIVMNNTLTYYGGLSRYGADIPLAAVGVISKVNIVVMAFVLGIAQGCQPIHGFNYGAKNYHRVRETYIKAAIAVTSMSVLALVCFQLFPRQIVSIFGQGSEEYFAFAERYLRIFMLMVFANGIQPITANFFSSIGKAKMGIVMSLTRQIILLLPMLVIFPMIMGIDGVMYAGPIADTAAVALSLYLVIREMRSMPNTVNNAKPKQAGVAE